MMLIFVLTLILLAIFRANLSVLSPNRQLCFLPKDHGLCIMGSKPPDPEIRWYYDEHRDRCLVFRYSGCRGNANNFRNEASCMTECKGATNERICSDPVNVGGFCAGVVVRTRYYFDPIVGQCRPFIYAGCGGNSNHFVTLENCRQFCNWTVHSVEPLEESSPDKFCSFDSRQGPCDGQLIRWHFQQEEHRCQPFIYGGCEGNGNRFESENDCMSACEGIRFDTMNVFLLFPIVQLLRLMGIL